PQKQVLVMVPEIGLTPQLVARFAAALPGIEIAVLHSEVSERERARLWLLAANGQARLVIGTRLSIMTPMPYLALLIVDEEHDHSYKQQEGMRYSARDLAVWRAAQQLGAAAVLGSATPSMETWAQLDRKKYQLLSLPHRATGEPAAAIELIDTLKDPAREGLTNQSRQAIAQVLAQSGQVLVFLNRRGYAPVLSCSSCGWASQCADCSVATVLHRFEKKSEHGDASASRESIKNKWRLHCHHCGTESAVPRSCPDCGDTDLSPIGRGVQRLEDTLAAEFPQARILRIDRDTVRQGKALAAEIEKIQRHEVDIVVGTQMLAKGHDFARMRLVVVADADTQLVNPDFRAPERLFSTLIQVAGRAGRHEQSGAAARVLIQTRYPQHRLYRFLLQQDVIGFAQAELADRRAACLPPFSHMAAIRAAYRDEAKTRAVLQSLRDGLQALAKQNAWPVTAYGPVSRYPEKQAGKWRGQVILESISRTDLHRLLEHAEAWIAQHRALDFHIDIDPVEV
ncbi:MAG: primosomal protein N', partial [Betaproteobacteria bacterium]|nr:primosomal protein N' [Betaproteobacteria bacterium]